MAEMGSLQEDIDHADAWDLDSQLEQAMDALRCPPPDADVTVLSGGERRRVALCKLLLSKPDLLLLDEPTNHLDAESVQWLEQHLAKYPGAVLAVTHDRYFLDNVAQWILELDRGRAYPYEGNYSTYLEKKEERLKVQGKKDAKLAKRLKDELEWVRSERQGPPGQEQGPARPLRGDGGRGRAHPQARLRGDPDPAGPAPGQRRHRGHAPAQGLRRPGAHRRPVVHAAAQRHRRRHRPERRRQDDAVQDDRRPGEPGRRRAQDRRDRQDLLRRPEPRRPRPEEDRLGDRLRRPRLHQGRQRRDAVARLRVGVRLQGPGPAEAGRRALRRRAQPAQPGAHAQAGRQPAAARRADQRPRRRDARLARERAARVPRLRRGHQPRPVVPRPGRDAHPRLRGRRARTRPSGSGSRATSRPTRRTRSSGSAPRPPVRTGSPTASSPATDDAVSHRSSPRPQRRGHCARPVRDGRAGRR